MIKKIKKAMTLFETVIYINFIAIVFLVITHTLAANVTLYQYLEEARKFKDSFLDFEKDYIYTILHKTENSPTVNYECNNWNIIKRINWTIQKEWKDINCITLNYDNLTDQLILTVKRWEQNLILEYNIK